MITTGNHVWDQKEIMEYIDKEEKLLRPKNLFEPAPGRGFNIYNTKENIKIETESSHLFTSIQKDTVLLTGPAEIVFQSEIII